MAELDSNEALITAVDQVRANEKWNHALTYVVESAKIPNVIEFLIIGEDKKTGSILKIVVSYNKPTNQAFIVSVTEELVEVVPITETTTVPTTTITTNTSASTTQSPNTPSTSTPVISLAENQVYVVEEGCSTHTYYMSPFAPDIQTLANQLKNVRQVEAQNISTPIIADPSLTPRRLVISENCEGSNYKEVALVEGDTISTREYFTYYFEVTSPQKTWFYLGMRNKTQSSQVYSNPYSFPIYVTDPSFLLYPSASLYFERGLDQLFASKLSTADQQTFQTLTPVATSEKDRLMGKISRFAVDGVSSNNSRYRMTGWRILSVPQGFEEDLQMISMVCPEAMITESYIIGTSPTSNGTTNQTA